MLQRLVNIKNTFVVCIPVFRNFVGGLVFWIDCSVSENVSFSIHRHNPGSTYSVTFVRMKLTSITTQWTESRNLIIFIIVRTLCKVIWYSQICRNLNWPNRILLCHHPLQVVKANHCFRNRLSLSLPVGRNRISETSISFSHLLHYVARFYRV